MSIYYEDERVTLHQGDCLEVLTTLPDSSVDAVVTDPPYGLEFMGREWDAPWKSGAAGSRGESAAFGQWCEQWARECLRILKPGGHMLAFGGTRTWHRLATAIEDAGFEVRDSIAWMYGEGFPKSLDVSKAIDKREGVWRGRSGPVSSANSSLSGPNYERVDKGIPATPQAQEWDGWGTALKPAFEPIVVARKPLAGTVASNVLEHGTGALNIAACRIGSEVRVTPAKNGRKGTVALGGLGPLPERQGRWPANVILDDHAAAELDAQSGERPAGGKVTGRQTSRTGDSGIYGPWGAVENIPYGDTGGASRFFYCAKADTGERPLVDGIAHPTVKPLDLMRWLIRLVTPPAGPSSNHSRAAAPQSKPASSRGSGASRSRRPTTTCLSPSPESTSAATRLSTSASPAETSASSTSEMKPT